MIRSTRRRFGLTLLALLAVQSLAAPLGACGGEHQGHEGGTPEAHAGGHAHDGAMPMAISTGSESDAGAVTPGAPDRAPVDCLALAACGAPAIGASVATVHMVSADRGARKARLVLDDPVEIVLGLTTPPPKI